VPSLASRLNRCLDALREGRHLQHLLRRYSTDRDQLIDLLRVSTEVAQVQLPGPDPAFKLRTRNLMLGVAAARRQSAAQHPRAWLRRPAWRLGLAGALCATLVGGGMVAASAQSLPGNPLYGVKRGVEGVQLALTLDPAANTRLRLQVATRRLAEAQQLGTQGRVSEALGLITTYTAEVDAVGRQVASTPLRPSDAGDLERALGVQQAEADGRLNAVAAQFAARGQGDAAASVKHDEHQADQALTGTRTALHGHAAEGSAPGQGDSHHPTPEAAD
jgi:hypothetical protein